MRTIKFRAWNPEKKVMLYDFDQEGAEAYGLKVGGNIHTLVWNTGLIYESLMQFTGLLDKNGKEIYEGDIVATKVFCSNKFGTPAEVKYCEGRTFMADEYGVTICGFYLAPVKDADFYRAIHSNLEVIGNIYEKSLLEGEITI